MTELVEFPDICKLILDRIHEATGYDTGTRVPNPRTTPFILARRLGGPRWEIVADNPTVIIEAWADTDAEAHDLCQLARSVVYAMRGGSYGGTAFYRISEFAGPADNPDPLSSAPRYTCTLSLIVRGSPLSISS